MIAIENRATGRKFDNDDDNDDDIEDELSMSLREHAFCYCCYCTALSAIITA